MLFAKPYWACPDYYSFARLYSRSGQQDVTTARNSQPFGRFCASAIQNGSSFETWAFFKALARAIRGRHYSRADIWAGAPTIAPLGGLLMRFFAEFSGRRLTMLASAGILALALAACSSDGEQIAGSSFTQALAKDYTDLAGQASSLPAEPSADSSFFDSLFGDSDTSSDLLAKAYSAKADLANAGTEPEPEAASNPGVEAIRGRLMRALAAGKDQFPEQAARAQADYDCWILYGTVPSAAAAAQACKTSLDSSLVRLETAARPAPPTPPPAPPAPPAPVISDFTVYFDFDSWTLKAEQLAVLTNVINTARSGGQSNITIVGHTDTSGSEGYNQKLSVRRANVVVEALVDMGARKAALHASGVGETDLAVQTPDGVKEAKNRRTVITLQP
jgi:OOP family OmpA-OmpF porin